MSILSNKDRVGIGRELYGSERKNEARYRCRTCHGAGWIMNKNGDQEDCPNCEKGFVYAEPERKNAVTSTWVLTFHSSEAARRASGLITTDAIADEPGGNTLEIWDEDLQRVKQELDAEGFGGAYSVRKGKVVV